MLAGHSFGGLYIQSFAAQFPDRVAGMVLLDSTVPNPGPAQPTGTESYSLLRRVAALLPAVAHLGAGRLLNPFSYGTLPPRSRDEARANSATARHLGSWIEELLAASASAHQASLLTDLDGKPLIVLTADTGNDAKWQPAQEHMATLSTNSLHRVAHDTTHQIWLLAIRIADIGQDAITHNPASPAATALAAAARKADDPRTPVGVVGAHAASLRHGDQGRRGNGSSTF